MFSRVSVCPRGVGGCLPPRPDTLPWADTLPLGRHLPGRHSPLPAQCMLGYGQQAVGTHPTGMHSCSRYSPYETVMPMRDPPYFINACNGFQTLYIMLSSEI